jgi:SH3-like domain-containing protein
MPHAKNMFVWLCVLFLGFYTLADAKDMYILANQANVMPQASMDGTPIEVLDHGTKITVLETDDIWVRITMNDQSGWICKFVLTTQNPLDASVASAIQSINLNKQARKRASSYATAATTRGLAAKDTIIASKVDYAGLKRMESYQPTFTEVSDFKEQGGLK